MPPVLVIGWVVTVAIIFTTNYRSLDELLDDPIGVIATMLFFAAIWLFIGWLATG